MSTPVAVVPAAGRGTRLLPFTKAVPKELLPLGTVPALQYVLAEIDRSGLSEVLLVVSPEKEALRRFVTPDELPKNAPPELRALEELLARLTIRFVIQEEPLGLGHAVGLAMAEAKGRTAAVLLPDEVYPTPGSGLERLLSRGGGDFRILLREVPEDEVSRFGIVAGEEEAGEVRVHALVEKPSPEEAPSQLAIMGRYLLPPSILPYLEELRPGAGGELQLTDALHALVQAGEPLTGVVEDAPRLDLGDPKGLLASLAFFVARASSPR